jgi:hypothetical protein
VERRGREHRPEVAGKLGVLEAGVEEADGVGIRQAGAGPLDQLVAGLDGGDPQPARDQAASQLAGAAADLENVVAAAQAGQLAGTLDQLLGVGGPAALILGGNAVEDGAVAALGGGSEFTALYEPRP